MYAIRSYYEFRLLRTGGYGQLGDGADGGNRLASETKGADGPEIVLRLDLGSAVSFKAHEQIILIHTLAVIYA